MNVESDGSPVVIRTVVLCSPENDRVRTAVTMKLGAYDFIVRQVSADAPARASGNNVTESIELLDGADGAVFVLCDGGTPASAEMIASGVEAAVRVLPNLGESRRGKLCEVVDRTRATGAGSFTQLEFILAEAWGMERFVFAPRRTEQAAGPSATDQEAVQSVRHLRGWQLSVWEQSSARMTQYNDESELARDVVQSLLDHNLKILKGKLAHERLWRQQHADSHSRRIEREHLRSRRKLCAELVRLWFLVLLLQLDRCVGRLWRPVGLYEFGVVATLRAILLAGCLPAGLGVGTAGIAFVGVLVALLLQAPCPEVDCPWPSEIADPEPASTPAAPPPTGSAVERPSLVPAAAGKMGPEPDVPAAQEHDPAAQRAGDETDGSPPPLGEWPTPPRRADLEGATTDWEPHGERPEPPETR